MACSDEGENLGMNQVRGRNDPLLRCTGKALEAFLLGTVCVEPSDF